MGQVHRRIGSSRTAFKWHART